MATERRDPKGLRLPFFFVHNDQFYACRGGVVWRDNRGDMEDRRLPLQRFDFSTAQWSGVSPVSADHERQEKYFWERTNYDDTELCCAVLGDCAYTFGGFWEYGYAVHELNLETMVWRRLEPKNREDGPSGNTGQGWSRARMTLCVYLVAKDFDIASTSISLELPTIIQDVAMT